MSTSPWLNRSLSLGAATALSAVGLLTVPAVGKAAPKPASCEVQGSMTLWQSDYWKVEVPGSGKRFSGRASAHSVSSGTDQFGTVNGTISGTQPPRIDFTIDWENGHKSRYYGDVDASNYGKASGFRDDLRTDPPVRDGTTWDATAGLLCITDLIEREPPPQQSPPEQNPPQQAPPQQAPPAIPKATVIDEAVDVYDRPNEEPLFNPAKKLGVLQVGKQVELVGSCAAESWCQVKGPDVPTGQGFVWGHLQLPG